MRIIMVGKNDTWGTMLAWKETLNESMEYFQPHPAGGYVDKSKHNKYLINSLEEADIIFLHIAIRHPNRGFIDRMRFHNVNFEKYKDKTIVYLNGDREAKYNLSEVLKIYSNYKYFVASTPDIATILNIPFLPIPIDFPKPRKKYEIKNLKIPIDIRMTTRIHGQWEKTNEDIMDFENLGNYIKTKYQNKYLLKALPASFYSGVEKMITGNAHIRIFYDNKNGCYSHYSMLSASRQVVTISSLSYEYMPKFIEFTHTWTLPFVNVNNYTELRYNLEMLLSNEGFMESEAKRARRWMENFWSKEKHIKNLNNILTKFGFGSLNHEKEN